MFFINDWQINLDDVTTGTSTVAWGEMTKKETKKRRVSNKYHQRQ